MRLFLCMLLLLPLGACTSVPPPQLLIPAAQQLFVQGLEQVDAGAVKPAAFATLQQAHPASPWAQRAHTVQQLLQTIDDQQQRIDSLQREQRTCRQNDKLLRQQKEALEGDLQRLKQLLIDLETRRN